jgi:phosphatidylserine/phosphatidylglycerophosphate/cardiolipin synthase-like enzyme
MISPRHRVSLIAAAVAAAVALACMRATAAPEVPAKTPPLAAARAKVTTAFGPDCETLLIREIDRAKRDVRVAIFTFTRRRVSRALADAAERGVTVRVKYDAANARWRGMKAVVGYLRGRGIDCTAVGTADKEAKMHHKFAVIDGVRVLTGSYNFTTAATRHNDENLVLIESAAAANAFLAEFERLGRRRETIQP